MLVMYRTGYRIMVDVGMELEIDIPNRQQFLKCVSAFEHNERRDAMYKVASFLVARSWGQPSDMADALGILLLTWNQAWYRYGSFDFDVLERCIAHNLPVLQRIRERTIFTLNEDDEGEISSLFTQFLQALVRPNRPGRSPVAAAKTLHLLAPNFLPLWDATIARHYRCAYTREPERQYVRFCLLMKAVADIVKDYCDPSPKTLLKVIDEFNYARYAKSWCR